jgi:hypothetical protein
MGKSFKSSRWLPAAIKMRPHSMKWAAPLPKIIRVKHPACQSNSICRAKDYQRF